MNRKEYFNKLVELIDKGKINEAEKLRIANIPCKLIKFFSLGNDDSKIIIELNNSKLQCLENEKVWFSFASRLNDPFEFQSMYINEKRLAEKGWPNDIIDIIKQHLLNQTKHILVCSLSENTINNTPMWAYYTNNFNGFCVEYNVLWGDRIFPVLYEPERIGIEALMSNLIKNYDLSSKSIYDASNEIQKYTYTILSRYYIKHISWSHENEYRVLYPITDKDELTGKLYSDIEKETGLAIPISKIGLKTTRIIAGINCTDEHYTRLNEISHKLGCGDAQKAKISETKFTFGED